MPETKVKSEVPVVILCGGMGTRLREETEYRPKPLIEIGNRPILWHIMKIYGSQGFKQFVLCLGYKGEMIKQYFLNYRLMTRNFTLQFDSNTEPLVESNGTPEEWTITFAETGTNTMTGSRIRRIRSYIDSEQFMLTYGDGVADINLTELLKFHKSHGKLATVTAVHPIARFGELMIEGNRVVQFAEKSQVPEGFINGGFFVFNKGVFDYLSDDDGCVLEREPLERLACEGELMTYHHTGFWHCMDTYRDSLVLNQLWGSANPPWKMWSR
jgi:glucose-1-phosphate cytidylyltransferase